MTETESWDAFISHASEDKDGFARPLAEALVSLGASIWYDEFTLRLCDSLSESIDRGLARSRFGVVVISPDFISKAWTRHELRGLWAREISGNGHILPVWHNIEKAAVEAFSPTLADRIAVQTAGKSATEIALAILAEIRPDLHAAHPRAELIRRANGSALAKLEEEIGNLRGQLSECQCPYCASMLVSSIEAPIDEEEKHWDKCERDGLAPVTVDKIRWLLAKAYPVIGNIPIQCAVRDRANARYSARTSQVAPHVQ